LHNPEKFNIFAAYIFDALYKNHPMDIDIDFNELLKFFDGENSSISASDRDVFLNTVFWFERYGYIRATIAERLLSGEIVVSGLSLTEKGLLALTCRPVAVPESLSAQIKSAASSIGTEAGKSAVAEFVGTLVGAATKQMIGS
jgi:hypothetical protein